jgi:alanyl-tRNA synthetase
LQKVLSPEVAQKGSNITAERLRFDFNYPYKVERDLLDKVEDFVNEAIEHDCIVDLEEMDKQVAMDS